MFCCVLLANAVILACKLHRWNRTRRVVAHVVLASLMVFRIRSRRALSVSLGFRLRLYRPAALSSTSPLSAALLEGIKEAPVDYQNYTNDAEE